MPRVRIFGTFLKWWFLIFSRHQFGEWETFLKSKYWSYQHQKQLFFESHWKLSLIDINLLLQKKEQWEISSNYSEKQQQHKEIIVDLFPFKCVFSVAFCSLNEQLFSYKKRPSNGSNWLHSTCFIADFNEFFAAFFEKRKKCLGRE